MIINEFMENVSRSELLEKITFKTRVKPMTWFIILLWLVFLQKTEFKKILPGK